MKEERSLELPEGLFLGRISVNAVHGVTRTEAREHCTVCQTEPPRERSGNLSPDHLSEASKSRW